MIGKLLRILEVPLLVAVPLVLGGCAFLKISQTAILSLAVVVVALLVFFASFEAGRPALRQIMPTVVLSALAAAGRILFAALPDFKPTTAICIVSGIVFGRRVGFMVGALAALVSNFFFGQGPWTPWQMYAWGMIGYFAGLLGSRNFAGLLGGRNFAAQQLVVHVYGFVSALLFGFMLNSWYIVGYVHPLTWQSALIAYGASLPFDVTHGVATLAFLLVIYAPWRKKLERIRKKYDLG